MKRVAQAGGLAGTAVDLLFFPIDTVKTRLQSSQGFISAGGFKGVYKGVGSVVVGSAPGGTSLVPTRPLNARELIALPAAVFFCTYDTLKKTIPLPSEYAPVTHMIAASMGEVVRMRPLRPTLVPTDMSSAACD